MPNHWPQSLLPHTVVDWDLDGERLRGRRYGVIETRDGRLTAVHMRPWPKLLAWPEIWPVSRTYHARGAGDRCLLYYNQPWRYPNFLALKYVVTFEGSHYATVLAALKALDCLAELKRIDAILCDVSNLRISDRLLDRLGWVPHKPQKFHRNFIKRFYGVYPSTSPATVARRSSPGAQ